MAEPPAVSGKISTIPNRLRAFRERLGKEQLEIEDLKQGLSDMNRKISQAIRVRLKIVYRKSMLLEQWEETADPKQREKIMDSMRRLLNKERGIVDIFEKGIGEGIAILKEIIRLIKPFKPKREAIKEIDNLLYVLRYTNKKLSRMQRRIAKDGVEARFLETGRLEHFNAFKKAWRKEIKYDRDILKRVSPLTGDWFRLAGKRPLDKVITIGAVGSAAPVAASMLGAGPISVLAISVGALLGVMVGIVKAMGEYEKKLYEYEIEEAKKLSKVKGGFKKAYLEEDLHAPRLYK